MDNLWIDLFSNVLGQKRCCRRACWTRITTLHQEEDKQGAASSTCQRREEDDEQGEEEMEQEMEPEREQERDLLHQSPPATEPVTNVSHANKSSATSDISQRPGDGPQRPIRQNYPSRLIGNQQRSFNAAWFDTYSWLEYSVGMDATFCFAC